MTKIRALEKELEELGMEIRRLLEARADLNDPENRKVVAHFAAVAIGLAQLHGALPPLVWQKRVFEDSPAVTDKVSGASSNTVG